MAGDFGYGGKLNDGLAEIEMKMRITGNRKGWATRSSAVVEMAFTRLDMICAAILTAMVMGLAAFNLLGERGRIFRCAHNLKKLGWAMQAYADDHDGALPAASDNRLPATWDTMITPYLRPDLVNTNSAYAKRLLVRTVEPDFVCPSDTLVRAHPRTYVMAWHDMGPDFWPPGSDNATGVGLTWDKRTADALLGTGAWEEARTNHSILTPVKFSQLPDPGNTLFLTELVRADNHYGNSWMAAVKSAQEQVGRFTGNRSQFHFGCFNYLMADGHVELLSPFQIGNAGSYDAVQQTGIWTIKAGD